MSESYLDELLDELVPARSRDSWDDVRQRARRAQRRYVVLVAALAVLVLAPATWAAWKVFAGTPAPRPVRKAFVFDNRSIAEAGQQIGRAFPQAEAKKAHGVLQVQTSRGPLDLWAAPSTTGGTCFIIGLEADMKSGMQVGSVEACTQANEPAISATAGTKYEKHGPPTLLYGYAKGREKTVQVKLVDGRTMTLPVVEHFFLAALQESGGFASITGRDAAGHIIARCTSTDSYCGS